MDIDTNAMDVDEIADPKATNNNQSSNNCTNNPLNPNTNKELKQKQQINLNPNTMDVDTDANKENDKNKDQIKNIFNTISKTTNNQIIKQKKSKKRKRNEMEIDSDTNNNNNNNNSIAKKRKISSLHVSAIEPIPAKWKNKYILYKNQIFAEYSNFPSLLNIADPILGSGSGSDQLVSPHSILINLDCIKKSLNNFICDLIEFINVSSDNEDFSKFNFDKYIPLISSLVYSRNDSLTNLTAFIQEIIVKNDSRNILDQYRIYTPIRELILKSSERKLYGIKPAKNINKNQEIIDINTVNNWKKCRIYIWEALDMSFIIQQYHINRSEISTLSTLLRKYASFCQKYDYLLNKKKLSSGEKDKILQKNDDELVAWLSKQKVIKQKKLKRDKDAKKKKEERDQLIKQRQQKKEEAEKLKKEKAEKKLKEKQEKLKAKQQKEKEKQEREKEKEKNKNQNKIFSVINNKTPKMQIKKRKASFLDNWVKVTKFVDTSNPNTTPIIIDKTLSESISLSPNKTLYQRVFKPPIRKKGVIYADLKYNNNYNSNNTDDGKEILNKFQAIRSIIKPTKLPVILVNLNDLSTVIKDASEDIDNMVSKMQIDNDNDSDSDKEMKDISSNNNKMIKIQFKYRYFSEDYRPQYFGVNNSVNKININDLRKLSRNPCCRKCNVVNYDGDDSGVEWYDDIDDLEGDDIDLDDEDDIDDDCKLNNDIRGDGFENDGFIINENDDNDEYSLNDKNIMQNIQKQKELKSKFSKEYPIKYQNKRKRGDNIDKPINIHFKSLNINSQNDIQKLILKKTVILQNNNDFIMDDQKDNDIEYLLQIENKNDFVIENDINDNGNDKKDKKRKKKKKDKKKKKKKDKKKKKRNNGKEEADVDDDENELKQMDCDNNDGDDDDDEDDDIKMVNNDKNKLTKQNTLSHYFTPVKSNNNNQKNDQNKKQENKTPKTNEIIIKKKKRRVVCELVE